MENKYYTPTREDLYIGAIYEWRNINEDDTWRQTDINDPEIFYHCIRDIDGNGNEDMQYRIKYLDKEDIESEGWKYSDENKHSETFFIKTSINNIEVKFILFLWKDRKMYPWIQRVVPIYGKEPWNIWDGEIKSINELRKLMKWLQIK